MTALATRPRTASARRTADTLLHGPAHSPAVLPRGEEIARRARTEQGREELRRVRSLAGLTMNRPLWARGSAWRYTASNHDAPSAAGMGGATPQLPSALSRRRCAFAPSGSPAHARR